MTISNRDLLRAYKDYKKKLVCGELDTIRVPQKDGSVLLITLESKKTPFETLLGMIKEKPLKELKRPEQDLFDYV